MVLISLAHDFILANMVTGFYNKLLSYFVLFTFGHEVQHLQATVSTHGIKSVGHNSDTGIKNHLDFASYREKLRKHLLLITDTEKILIKML